MSSSESSPSIEETSRPRYPHLSQPLMVRFPCDDPSRELYIMIRDPILRSRIMGLLPRRGPLPAPMEAMTAVKITEAGSECAICMAEYKVGEEAKETACKHRYHSGCIEKWLRIHGSCPVCRHKIPAEEGDESGKGGNGDD